MIPSTCELPNAQISENMLLYWVIRSFAARIGQCRNDDLYSIWNPSCLGSVRSEMPRMSNSLCLSIVSSPACCSCIISHNCSRVQVSEDRFSSSSIVNGQNNCTPSNKLSLFILLTRAFELSGVGLLLYFGPGNVFPVNSS